MYPTFVDWFIFGVYHIHPCC